MQWASEGAYVKLAQEEGKERRRDGQRRRKDDPEVAQVHLGRLGILSDCAEMRKAVSKHIRCQHIGAQRKKFESVVARHSQEAEERVLFDWELLDQLAERIDLVLAPAQVLRGRLIRSWSNLDDFRLPFLHAETNGLTYHAEKVGLQRPREQWRWQVPQVLLQQAGDGVEVVELAALEQVDVPFGVEAFFQLPDHVGTPRQAEDAFLVLGVLQAEVRTSTTGDGD